MASNKDLLKENKQSMLAELESIKSLLDDELDNIPVLQETVTEEDGQLTVTRIPSLEERVAAEKENPPQRVNKDAIADTAPMTVDGVLPGQQSLFSEKDKRKAKARKKQSANSASAQQRQHFADNPFLPQHIRQRLNGASGLSDEHIPTLSDTPPMDAVSTTNMYTEQMVDELIAEYLPKIEAELRQKLLKAISHQAQAPKE